MKACHDDLTFLNDKSGGRVAQRCHEPINVGTESAVLAVGASGAVLNYTIILFPLHYETARYTLKFKEPFNSKDSNVNLVGWLFWV